MIVCHCTAVTEGTVTAVIAAGARDEFDVADACGAGSVCGGCVPTISRLLRDRPSAPDRPGAPVEGQPPAAVAAAPAGLV